LGNSLLKDILCLDDCAVNAKGEKPLLPVNFVSNPKGIVLDQDQMVTTDKDGNLKLKPCKNKPTADKIVVGQWIGANARILSKLAPKFSAQDLIDYRDYMRKVGDLLNQFTYSSVFCLDNDHRVDVNFSDRRWNDIDCTLEVYYLKKKEDGASNSNTMYSPVGAGGGNKKAVLGKQRNGSNICWDYNSSDGCRYGDSCRYLHQDLPAAQRAPRFQSKGQGASTKP
jgi:hypothetical protein